MHASARLRVDPGEDDAHEDLDDTEGQSEAVRDEDEGVAHRGAIRDPQEAVETHQGRQRPVKAGRRALTQDLREGRERRGVVDHQEAVRQVPKQELARLGVREHEARDIARRDEQRPA
eukprot:CAMPEP_0182588080 /NCGR_PEP_ID=MMETSP1324-20130603/66416_1 /TAXON_ID=236786 /ORGANISM="Florenciella sp., Strain RCC1587" /LENGTH=117 /DNA_ID=CAMNT_0024805121 /DNA_START=118 /DNA_END=471 /DNA_ORIENTATION=-